MPVVDGTIGPTLLVRAAPLWGDYGHPYASLQKSHPTPPPRSALIRSASVSLQALVDKLTTPRPELIIIGTRGLGAASRALASMAELAGFGLGSVSSYLTHHSKIPVCVVPQVFHEPTRHPHGA